VLRHPIGPGQGTCRVVFVIRPVLAFLLVHPAAADGALPGDVSRVVEVGANARKVDRGDTEVGCPVRRGRDGVWQVRGYPAGRAVLRSTGTVQAGLGIETVEKLPSKIRRPVLYRDGPEHREHRRQTAQYFTPRRVDERYRDVMVCVADAQVAKLRQAGRSSANRYAWITAVTPAPPRRSHRHLAGRVTLGRGDRPHRPVARTTPPTQAGAHPPQHLGPCHRPDRRWPRPARPPRSNGPVGSERDLQALDPDASQPVGMLHHDRGDL
jgi:hypothetical protein